MMNPEIKTKWLEALRSGEYKQGVNYLKDDGRYCCLGVLCDLYAKEFNEPFDSGYDNQTPSFKIKSWAGLNTVIPDIKYKERETWITNLNDLENLTFKELADLIEEQL